MNKLLFCKNVQTIVEEVRKDVGMTLEDMAWTIGLSKKTLIQIEKTRNPLKWAEAVTFVTIFNEHDLVKSQFGDEAIDIVQTIAIQKSPKRQLRTLGGESWWKTLRDVEGYRLQQHKISKHFRILDQDNYRVYFSYSKSEALHEISNYVGKTNE